MPGVQRALRTGEADPLGDAFPGAAGAPARALIAASRVLEDRGIVHGPLPPLRAALAREIQAARAALAMPAISKARRATPGESTSWDRSMR